jgi:hypothetical protein
MAWDDEDWSYDEGPEEEYPRDPSIDAAKDAVESFFEDPLRREGVFYVMQLQVIFERTFFHWITYKALDELVEEGRLRDRIEQLAGSTIVRFIFHRRCRSQTRQIKRKIDLIRRFSAEEVSRACGRWAELLFFTNLLKAKFTFIGENINEFQGRKWTRTGHDLDYIVERDGKAYGCEIKNRFGYISRDEMITKMNLCRFLDVSPLFILRRAPKNYIEAIRTNGRGFTLIFETHIYSSSLRDCSPI